MVRAGWPLVIVSNQSGIGRGLYGPEAFAAINRRIESLLASEQVRFLAAYFCPHLPGDPCRCRKPGVELFERATHDHQLALDRSWFLGDRSRDVEPAAALGGRGLLIAHPGREEDVQRATALGVTVAADLLAAARVIEAQGE